MKCFHNLGLLAGVLLCATVALLWAGTTAQVMYIPTPLMLVSNGEYSGVSVLNNQGQAAVLDSPLLSGTPGFSPDMVDDSPFFNNTPDGFLGPAGTPGGSADFTVQVLEAQPTSGVPEPATLPLLAVGVCTLLVRRRVRLGIGRCGA